MKDKLKQFHHSTLNFCAPHPSVLKHAALCFLLWWGWDKNSQPAHWLNLGIKLIFHKHVGAALFKLPVLSQPLPTYPASPHSPSLSPPTLPFPPPTLHLSTHPASPPTHPAPLHPHSLSPPTLPLSTHTASPHTHPASPPHTLPLHTYPASPHPPSLSPPSHSPPTLPLPTHPPSTHPASPHPPSLSPPIYGQRSGSCQSGMLLLCNMQCVKRVILVSFSLQMFSVYSSKLSKVFSKLPPPPPLFFSPPSLLLQVGKCTKAALPMRSLSVGGGAVTAPSLSSPSLLTHAFFTGSHTICANHHNNNTHNPYIARIQSGTVLGTLQ